RNFRTTRRGGEKGVVLAWTYVTLLFVCLFTNNFNRTILDRPGAGTPYAKSSGGRKCSHIPSLCLADSSIFIDVTEWIKEIT
ncbi:MAG: hypothetical protein WD425_05410, partial [Nitrospirales bacterium]